MEPNRVAFVTGASRGIGKACALALADAGFDVAVAARTVVEGQGRDDSLRGQQRPVSGSLQSTTALVESRGRQTLPVVLDLLDRTSLDTAARQGGLQPYVFWTLGLEFNF